MAILISPVMAGANTGLAEEVSNGRIRFDSGRAVGVQTDAAAAVAIPEEEEFVEVSFVRPTAVDGQGTEADPIPTPRRSRARGLSANYTIPAVPIRPKGILILGILATIATSLTAGGLLTES